MTLESNEDRRLADDEMTDADLRAADDTDETDEAVEVSEIRMARDPLTATARGALIAAMYEK